MKYAIRYWSKDEKDYEFIECETDFAVSKKLHELSQNDIDSDDIQVCKLSTNKTDALGAAEILETYSLVEYFLNNQLIITI